MIATSATARSPSRTGQMVYSTLPYATMAAFLFGSTFNLQPDIMRYMLTAAFGVYLALCALTILGSRVRGQGLGLVAFLGFIMLNAIHILVLGRTETIYFFSQYLFAFLVSTVLFLPNSAGLSRRRVNELFLFILAIFLIAIFQAYFFEPLVVRTVRLAPFNGGEDGLHPSAYAILAFMAFFALVHERLEPYLKWISIGAFVLGLLTIEIYGVRTAELALAVAVLTVGIFAVAMYYGMPLGNIVVVFAAYILPAVLAIVIYASSSAENLSLALSDYSSGRSIAWQERLDIFMNRSLFDQMIGNGAGSDFFRGIATWRWTEKDSHNDFLSFLLEFGVLGLLIFICWCLAMILAARSVREIAVIAGLIVASFVSNGVLLRPTLFILFAFAIVVSRMPPTAVRRTPDEAHRPVKKGWRGVRARGARAIAQPLGRNATRGRVRG